MSVLERILEEIEKVENEYCHEGHNSMFCMGACSMAAEVKEIIRSHMDEASDDDWIPVSERLPEEDDLRFYMCVLENHEEDLPMFCQYNEMYGFGFWSDIYDPISLGFVDTEFSSMDELGYEKVVAWRPLPEPYRTTEE